jgi:hypothetical protein
MDISVYEKLSQLDALGDTWDRLSEQTPFFVPAFADLREALQDSACQFRVLVAVENAAPLAMACFIYRTAIKRYQIANRKLFDLAVPEVTLFGSCVVGQPNESIIEKFLRLILEASGFDLLNTGDILVESPLYRTMIKLHGGGLIVRQVTRKRSVRWLIPLPKSFDEYINSLRPTTRKAVNRDRRLFEKQNPELIVIHHASEVERFLRDGEKVSRLTYQWNVAARLRNDEPTRRRLERLAERGRFRGYLAYINGEPCAFAWVEMNRHHVCFYHTPGFDPRYGKLSPGTALLMKVIRDLIENTKCKLFDLATTENERGYKSRFGTVSLDSAWLELGQWRRPYSLFVMALDEALNFAKNLVSWIIGYDKRKK